MKLIYGLCLILSFLAFPIAISAAGTPPPNGFISAVASTEQQGAWANFGANPRMTLDANGDPVIAYLWVDPNGDGNDNDTILYFVAWSRTLGKFAPPVKVAVPGIGGSTSANITLTIARDASTNTLGIAFIKQSVDSDEVHIALSSDGGNTWKEQTQASGKLYASPSLAMANGSVYLAYISDPDGPRYVTGKLSDAPTQWSSQLAPLQSGYKRYLEVVSLALDSNLKPALAYVLGSDAGADMHLVFWRPGTSTNTTISGTQGQWSEDADIKLSFFGTQPRAAFAGPMSANNDYNHMVWAIASTNDGSSWSAPLNIPSDGDYSLDAPISLVSGSQGQAAIVMASFHGGTSNGMKCGFPKLATSNSNFSNWSTCAPGLLGQPNLSVESAAAVYGPNDRLYVAFQVDFGYDLPYGVVLWAQPVTSSSAPIINDGGITHGASFLPQVSPGALATIFGTNFLDTATGATSTPLPTTLATAASRLTVTVNGELAPLNYANPTQINFQVPWDVVLGTASVVVTVNGVGSNPAPMTVISAAPGIFVYSGTRAVVQDSNYSLIGSASPAKPGGTVIVYLTGSGPVKPTPVSGAASPGAPDLCYVQASVSATVGALPAQVTFAGLAPGFVGLLQVNVVIPMGLTPGDNPLTITINDQKSNSPLLAVGN